MFQKKGLAKNRSSIDSVKNFYTLITLPAHLRGYVKYVVVLLPLNGCTYSLGIKYVCQSEGARELLQRLDEQRDRKHKKPLHAFLCSSAALGTICPFGWSCTEIHCTVEGFRAKRTWDRPVKAIRSLKPPPNDASGPGSPSTGDNAKSTGLSSPSSDQGTDESITEKDSIASDDWNETAEGCEYPGAEFSQSLMCNSPAQPQHGHTVHDPYTMLANEVDQHTTGASWKCSCRRETEGMVGLQARLSILNPPAGGPPQSVGAGSGWPVFHAVPLRSPVPAVECSNCWSSEDQWALNESLRRVRDRIQRLYVMANQPPAADRGSQGSDSPSSSARSLDVQEMTGPQASPWPSPACTSAASSGAPSRTASRSWADEVEDACEMDFSFPPLAALP